MSDKRDYKKEDKQLYQPKRTPALVDVPTMTFIAVRGTGDPNEADGAYSRALQTLYTLSYTIKMSKMGGDTPAGYFEYVVPPLEGLWWSANDEPFQVGPVKDKSNFAWLSMIRQPEFVDQSVFDWACAEARRKKPAAMQAEAELCRFTEGRCVQIMHHGPYDDEPASVALIDGYMAENGLQDAIGEPSVEGILRQHHEIYLGDPRRTAPDKLRTVLRHPIR